MTWTERKYELKLAKAFHSTRYYGTTLIFTPNPPRSTPVSDNPILYSTYNRTYLLQAF